MNQIQDHPSQTSYFHQLIKYIEGITRLKSGSGFKLPEAFKNVIVSVCKI